MIFLSKLYWALFCSILLMIALYWSILTNTHFYSKLFLHSNGLSDDKIVSFTKTEYCSLVYSISNFIKSLKPMSDKWFDVICWSSLLLRIFMMK